MNIHQATKIERIRSGSLKFEFKNVVNQDRDQGKTDGNIDNIGFARGLL